jgi:hypothetical protein
MMRNGHAYVRHELETIPDLAARIHDYSTSLDFDTIAERLEQLAKHARKQADELRSERLARQVANAYRQPVWSFEE